MRIVHGIASRGRPEMLERVIARTLARSTLETTRVVVGIDDDDPRVWEYLALPKNDRVFFMVNARRDSIGEVYNLIAQRFEADLYINGSDDISIETMGWDERLSESFEYHFPDGLGVIGFGKGVVNSAIPVFMACSRKMIDAMGYYLQSWTPYWWHDAWLWEIACYADVMRMSNIDVHHVPEACFQTQGRREVLYWAAFFDETRAERRAIADRINPKEAGSAWQLTLSEIFYKVGEWLRNPEHVAHHFPDPSTKPDERYLRIWSKAESHLNTLRLGRAA